MTTKTTRGRKRAARLLGKSVEAARAVETSPVSHAPNTEQHYSGSSKKATEGSSNEATSQINAQSWMPNFDNQAADDDLGLSGFVGHLDLPASSE
jgi:hypothetical protein